MVVYPTKGYAQNRGVGKDFATRSVAMAKNGMAATSQPLATTTALQILMKGGHAVDAALAANAVLGLVEPTSNGIGGDIFVIVWDNENKQLHGFNGSGRSPKALTLDEFREKGLDKIPNIGPLSVSVPGAVDGWFQVHEKFGRLPMTDVLQPAIDYARAGFPVTQVIAKEWKSGAEDRRDFPGFKEVYMPGGKTPDAGEVFKNPALATTLETIAREGRDAYYKGDIARAIAKYMEEMGGFLAYNDLAAHKGNWVTPVSTDYRGYTVWELPPNGQGIAALQMLNILENFDVASMGFGSPEYLHLLVEAKKIAYEDRAKFYADPEFNKLPIDWLISKEYGKQRSALIDFDKPGLKYDPGDPKLEKGDTIYLTVADGEGNMVSLIQSNFSGLGSGMVPWGLGFQLQNRGALFNLEEGHFNTYEPGKRPFHTIIPAMVTKEGEPFFSFGVMGGAMQPQGHVQILVNMIDFGMNVQEAGDAPRMRHDGSSQPTGEVMKDGGTVNLEFGFSDETLAKFLMMGHRVKVGSGGYGGYQGIRYDPATGVFFGATESRKDGIAAGY
ncbi:MAG: gamma-glutamyltransferase [Acidobacteria bacterium]|nr:gamma-glutamyltransferase [Acidobacteriota bacterium]MDA1236772.1 gamma-glutamyltransferase [Acidobacteriota bacterium]